MNNKVVLGLLVVVVVLVGGYFLMKGSYSQPVSTNIQETSTPAMSQTSPTEAMPVTAGQNGVEIANFAFSPASLTVKVGDKVTFTNKDSMGHSATADDGSFDTGVLNTGKSGTVTFSKTGTFAYHCSVHPNMKGTVVVQ